MVSDLRMSLQFKCTTYVQREIWTATEAALLLRAMADWLEGNADDEPNLLGIHSVADRQGNPIGKVSIMKTYRSTVYKGIGHNVQCNCTECLDGK